MRAGDGVVSGADLGIQAWARSKEDPVGPPAAERLVLDSGYRGWRKPRGLWTSTWNGEQSDWMRWCRSEEFRHDFREVWLLEPRVDARVYRIDGMPELVALCERWPGESPFPDARNEQVLDWRAVASEFDAVHLTDRGEWQTRLPPPGLPSLYGWDCESTCWFSFAFEGVERAEPEGATRVD